MNNYSSISKNKPGRIFKSNMKEMKLPLESNEKQVMQVQVVT